MCIICSRCLQIFGETVLRGRRTCHHFCKKKKRVVMKCLSLFPLDIGWTYTCFRVFPVGQGSKKKKIVEKKGHTESSVENNWFEIYLFFWLTLLLLDYNYNNSAKPYLHIPTIMSFGCTNLLLPSKPPQKPIASDFPL